MHLAENRPVAERDIKIRDLPLFAALPNHSESPKTDFSRIAREERPLIALKAAPFNKRPIAERNIKIRNLTLSYRTLQQAPDCRTKYQNPQPDPFVSDSFVSDPVEGLADEAWAGVAATDDSGQAGADGHDPRTTIT
jgi:hypothetical protein